MPNIFGNFFKNFFKHTKCARPKSPDGRIGIVSSIQMGTKALYPQADCFPQRKGGGSERTAGQSKKQRQGDCKMNAINWKKLLLPNIPYLLFVYLFDKVGQAVRLAPGADLSGKLDSSYI